MAKGLVAAFPFHNGAQGTVAQIYATTLSNVAGNERINGTLTATTTPSQYWASSDRGGCVHFDGVDDTVSLGTAAFINGAKMSISLWAKLDALSTYCTVIGRSATTAWASGWGINRYVLNSTANFGFFVGNNATQAAKVAATTVTANVWHNMVGTYDGTNINFYLDLVAGDPDTTDVGNVPETGTLSIGGKLGGYANADGHMAGFVRDIRIWNRVISERERQLIYAKAV